MGTDDFAIPTMQPRMFAELLQDAPASTIKGDASVSIERIVFDSREVTPGALFVAIPGGYVDGRDFLADALHRGAVAALVESDTPPALVDGYQAVGFVRNARAVLAQAAAVYFDTPSAALRLIGVTGTDGKTTTSHMIEAICRHNGLRTGLIGTVAVRVGDHQVLHESRQTTPESLLIQGYLAAMREAQVDVAVMEATSHGLALHRVDGCLFDVGVVTNITHEHLDFHGSVAAYRLAKGSLLSRVAESRRHGKLAAVVLNVDDEGARSVMDMADGCTLTTFGLNQEHSPAVTACDIQRATGGTAFTLVTPFGEVPVLLPMPGLYNVANALAASGACLTLGLRLDDIAEGLNRLPSVPGRMQVIDEGQPYSVIVDYAHTPEALSVLLRDVRTSATGRVLVLFGSAGERDIAKRMAQGRIGVELADYAVFTSEDPRFEDPDEIIEQIAEGAIEFGGRRGVDFTCIEDRADAIRWVLGCATAGDVVVLAGKGHEHSMIYGTEKRPWDEAEQARSTLREMGFGAPAERTYLEGDQR